MSRVQTIRAVIQEELVHANDQRSLQEIALTLKEQIEYIARIQDKMRQTNWKKDAFQKRTK